MTRLHPNRAPKESGRQPDVPGHGKSMRVMQVMAGAREGGAETQFVSVVSALHAAGLDQRVIIRRNPVRAEALRAGGVEPIELRFGRWTDFSTRRALRREIAAYRPDVVLTWMNRASDMVPSGDFLRLGRLGGYYDVKYYRRCDHLLCISPGIIEHVVRQGWPRDRVHHMQNFARVRDMPAIDRASLDTPEGVPVVLSLGRLHTAKAIDVLLQAAAVERRVHVWLAGEGPIRAELEKLSAALGLTDRVRFLGWRDDREALLNAADICVFPSRYEPLGSVVLEAWAHRRPLIAAASDGPASLIRDGDDGLLVPIDDAPALAAAMTRIIDDPGLAQRLVEAGWRRYQAEFTEAAAVARWIDLFRRLLKQHIAAHEPMRME